MTSNCAECGALIETAEIFRFAGEILCEDCYLERRIKPVACDPWAVYAARKISGETPQLTDLQQRILGLLREKGPLPATQICSYLNVSEARFETNFATLRHMELARGFKDGHTVRYTLF